MGCGHSWQSGFITVHSYLLIKLTGLLTHFRRQLIIDHNVVWGLSDLSDCVIAVDPFPPKGIHGLYEVYQQSKSLAVDIKDVGYLFYT